MGEGESREDELDHEALAPRRAAAAVALISQELARQSPNWSTLRLLAARLVQIADEMDRSTEAPDPGD
jgi:hypothetical protein